MPTIVTSDPLQRPRAVQPSFTGRPVKTAGTAPAHRPDQLSIRFGHTVSATQERQYLDDLRTRGVVVTGGGGTMGADIAQSVLNGAVPVTLQDLSAPALENAQRRIQSGLEGAAQRSLITQHEASHRLGLLRGSVTALESIPTQPGPAMVIEAIKEDLAIKGRQFAELNRLLPADTILATNTSSLSVDKLAEASGRPDRFIGLHFFLPAYKNKLVEIIPGRKTSPETVAKTTALVRAMGKIPIVCSDSPGFGVNRMLVPVMNEGIKIWEELVAAQKSQYASIHNSEPPAGVVALMERKAATTVEQAVKETLWPTFHKDPKVKDMLIGPFSGLNSPIYMGIIGEITRSLHDGLGDGYKPAATIQAKSEAFYALRRENPPDFEARFAKLQYPLGPAEIADPNLLPAVKERLQGLIIGVAMQLQDQGVITPEDLHRGLAVGTKWELMPYEMINQIGAKKALSLVENYAKTNPAFEVPSTLRALAAKSGKIPLNYVDTRREGDVAYLIINKPQRMNALDPAMLNSLRQAFRAAEADPSVKTIVFESNGGSHFVSGADIFALKDQFKGMNPAARLLTFRKLIRQGLSVYNEIATSWKPTVAKVNGTALGGGTELALACDYVVASEKATFGTPEVLYGIYPAWGGTERLPRKIGKTMARFMVLEGGIMKRGKGPAILSGKEAGLIGLADYVVPHADLDNAVRDMLTRGEFAHKPAARTVQQAEARTRSRVEADPRLAEKYQRYAEARLDELMAEELKPMMPDGSEATYRKVFELAEERLANAEKSLGQQARLERDIVRMALNYMAVEALGRAAKGKT